MYFAFKALLFQMRVASTIAIMSQKAMTGCLLIGVRRVFQVNRFVICQTATWHNEQTNVTE